MITEARLDEDPRPAGPDWITALRAPALQGLVSGGYLQMSLFDEKRHGGDHVARLSGVRPIYHGLEERVRAHVFLCMLAYYLEWNLRTRLAPMLYDDDKEAAEALQRVSQSRKNPPNDQHHTTETIERKGEHDA